MRHSILFLVIAISVILIGCATGPKTKGGGVEEGNVSAISGTETSEGGTQTVIGGAAGAAGGALTGNPVDR